MDRVQQVIIILANWCPHCVPLSLENAKRMSEDLKVPLRVLDIDDQKQESLADKLVEQYGDFSSITKARLVDLFKSEFYQTLLKTQNESSQRNI